MTDRPNESLSEWAERDRQERARRSGICPAHGSWVSATAEGCPTCVMLTQLRYCPSHILGGRATTDKCELCAEVRARFVPAPPPVAEERVCILCLRKFSVTAWGASKTCVGCRIATRGSSDDEHPSPRDESWVGSWNAEQGR